MESDQEDYTQNIKDHIDILKRYVDKSKGLD